jgi:hypothetical protein
MKFKTAPYLEQRQRWPDSGRHILAQFDAESLVVYQAYRPETSHFAAKHGYFGGAFSLDRMSWIKPNLLWMMFRSGWGIKEGQEVTLAIGCGAWPPLGTQRHPTFHDSQARVASRAKIKGQNKKGRESFHLPYDKVTMWYSGIL